jgi:hypothetical protein
LRVADEEGVFDVRLKEFGGRDEGGIRGCGRNGRVRGSDGAMRLLEVDEVLSHVCEGGEKKENRVSTAAGLSSESSQQPLRACVVREPSNTV